MYQLRNWRKSSKRILATALMAILLLITPALTGTAQADDQNLVAAAQDFFKTIDNARTVFNDFSRDSQGFLDQGIDEAEKIFRDLPKQLERLSTESNANDREKIRRNVVAKQKTLNEFAQAFDDRIAEADRADRQFQKSVDDAYNTLLQSAKGTQDSLKSQSHQQVASLDQSFRETAKAISSLSDSTNRILNGKISLQQSRWNDQLSALSQTFDNVNGVLKTLVD